MNSNILFKEKTNYAYFLRLYDLYISPIAETYAWCLMKNHFHFLVRIKEVEEITKDKKI
jgi:putative transposase